MNSNEIREMFINYFAQRGHEIVTTSSLVPTNDATLLFTNAGMVQFKDVFLGHDKRSYQRAVSAQRCVRAGGKHNDLDAVGYTARHHTFFEMLGNFSFGDYFKREAIAFAWNFLTQVLKLPAEKLWVTVFENDKEAEDIWLNEIKIDPKRFSRCGEKDNFWSMGDTGPCGPCTEIFYDHGAQIPGGPPGSPDADADRYIEIWNLVFMQFDRLPSGELVPLPKPSVDTGMGLERLTAVLQGVHNNYETDLFQPILAAIAQLSGNPDVTNTSMRVIADHIRSTAFLITDGVLPSNEGCGYVLRRIIRRAIRHGHKLGLTENFFYKLVKPLADKMGQAYPELLKAQAHIEQVLLQEEEQFAKTLDQGLKILEQDIAALASKEIPGEIIFKLYDTYGFPPDLTGDIARERGLTLDLNGFAQAMEQQRSQSQAANKFTANYHAMPVLEQVTTFTGYEKLMHPVHISALIVDGKVVDKVSAGQDAIVVLEESPFYAQSGGQVGDQGKLVGDKIEFIVEDTQKQGAAFAHIGKLVQGSLQTGTKLEAQVDYQKRQATALNHSATHLLHAALRTLLGNHVEQKGSLVAPDRLRFDFSHPKALTQEEISAIEDLVNQQIRANETVETQIMSPEQAISQGAMALFGEKYDENVRVLSMGNFSKELCGGTHVKRTGDIGFLKIIAESAVAAGIRRIEAVTGQGACDYVMQEEQWLTDVAQALKTPKHKATEKLDQLLGQIKQQEKTIADLQRKLAMGQGTDLTDEVTEVNGIKVLVKNIPDVDVKILRTTLDQLKDKLKNAVIVLATTDNERVNMIAGVTKPLADKLSANTLVQDLSKFIDGKGGGRNDMAQAGGTNLKGLEAALASVNAWVQARS